MSGKNINFDNEKIKKSNFYKKKRLSKIDEIDVDKILVSKKESYGTKNLLKYFIGYDDDGVIRPLSRHPLVKSSTLPLRKMPVFQDVAPRHIISASSCVISFWDSATAH